MLDLKIGTGVRVSKIIENVSMKLICEDKCNGFEIPMQLSNYVNTSIFLFPNLGSPISVNPVSITFLQKIYLSYNTQANGTCTVSDGILTQILF